MKKPELMAPAGSFKSLQAAIKAGADSVYFGVGDLNMRAKSANFSNDDLEEIVKICEENDVKSYLTLNTVMYDEDLEDMEKLCDRAKACGLSAILASDISVIKYANSIGLDVHMSTQANISNIEAVKFYAGFANTIVLARELSLDQIGKITKKIEKEDIRGPNGERVKIEAFVHGALCVAISGKCYMSLAQYNSSANRGACLQACRRKYRVIDEQTGDELAIDNKYIMSPKDLCTISMIDKLMQTNVDVFKIEGRARKPDYVYKTTRTYREAIESVLDNTYTQDKIEAWTKELKAVFNRGFWHKGYYLGKKLGEWSGKYGSKSTKVKKKIGKVTNYYRKNGIAEIQINSYEIKTGDQMLFTGNKTGALFVTAESIYEDDAPVKRASPKTKVTVPVPERVRENDEVYVIQDREK